MKSKTHIGVYAIFAAIWLFAVLYFIPYLILLLLRKIVDILLWPGKRVKFYPFLDKYIKIRL